MNLENEENKEKESIFDQFETDEETGEVIIPRATVGVAPDDEATKEPGAGEEDLPVLDLDFDFAESEDEAVPTEMTEEEMAESEMLESIDAALAEQMTNGMGVVMDEEPEEEEKKKNFWTRIPLWGRIAAITFGVLLLLCAFFAGTKPGRKVIYNLIAGYISGNVQRPSPEPLTPYPTAPATPALTPSAPLTPSVTTEPVTPAPTTIPYLEPRHEDYCYNILLIGYEALEYFGGGQRSDSMMIATINTKEKKLKLTSLMRDMYVKIDGYVDQKLNAAYAYGGAKLLTDTIEKNLKIKLDGYVVVGFDNFEWIIDRLGGVEVTLSAEEASYLNKTNYITKKEYRTVVPGKQKLNGNQALGYCRVRKVPTINGTGSDFGRTERQRMVLSQLFEDYKEVGVLKLLGILNDCLPKVTTNISKEDMSDILENVVENHMFSLETMRIPVAGTYESVRVGGDIGEVLAVKWMDNINALWEFTFGDTENGQ